MILHRFQLRVAVESSKVQQSPCKLAWTNQSALWAQIHNILKAEISKAIPAKPWKNRETSTN